VDRKVFSEQFDELWKKVEERASVDQLTELKAAVSRRATLDQVEELKNDVEKRAAKEKLKEVKKSMDSKASVEQVGELQEALDQKASLEQLQENKSAIERNLVHLEEVRALAGANGAHVTELQKLVKVANTKIEQLATMEHIEELREANDQKVTVDQLNENKASVARNLTKLEDVRVIVDRNTAHVDELQRIMRAAGLKEHEG